MKGFDQLQMLTIV